LRSRWLCRRRSRESELEKLEGDVKKDAKAVE